MSAHCDKCGSDLAYGTGEDWQIMSCPRCEMRAERDAAQSQRDRLLSAAKEWRNATESRLRLLDSRGEAAKAMLKADRDLISAIEEVGGE